jgi:hypothetical protein
MNKKLYDISKILTEEIAFIEKEGHRSSRAWDSGSGEKPPREVIRARVINNYNPEKLSEEDLEKYNYIKSKPTAKRFSKRKALKNNFKIPPTIDQALELELDFRQSAGHGSNPFAKTKSESERAKIVEECLKSDNLTEKQTLLCNKIKTFPSYEEFLREQLIKGNFIISR